MAKGKVRGTPHSGHMSSERREKLAQKKQERSAQKKQKKNLSAAQKAQEKLQNPNAQVSVRMMDVRLSKIIQDINRNFGSFDRSMRQQTRTIEILIRALKEAEIVNDEQILEAAEYFKKKDQEEREAELQKMRENQKKQLIEAKKKTDKAFVLKPEEEQMEWAEEEMKRIEERTEEKRRTQFMEKMIEGRKGGDENFAKLPEEEQIKWAQEQWEAMQPKKKDPEEVDNLVDEVSEKVEDSTDVPCGLKEPTGQTGKETDETPEA